MQSSREPSPAGAPVRVFVGTDDVQRLAVEVLAFSIRRHTDLLVEVRSLLDVQLPLPKRAEDGSRTGFSFRRFAIPELAERRGRAIYLDADMLVFKDIASLWELPFNGAKVLLQGLHKQQGQSRGRAGREHRIKQTAVMILDCGALDWDASAIVRRVGQDYSYEQLMHELCILRSDEIRYPIPFEWNSLEHYDEQTCLIHYTDMLTQPWVSPFNKNGWLWTAEVRRMIDVGALTWGALEAEVAKGHFRPSLLTELQRYVAEAPLPTPVMKEFAAEDAQAGYVVHRHLRSALSLLARARRRIGKALRLAAKLASPSTRQSTRMS